MYAHGLLTNEVTMLVPPQAWMTLPPRIAATPAGPAADHPAGEPLYSFIGLPA
jgi:hypothetical protein